MNCIADADTQGAPYTGIFRYSSSSSGSMAHIVRWKNNTYIYQFVDSLHLSTLDIGEWYK